MQTRPVIAIATSLKKNSIARFFDRFAISSQGSLVIELTPASPQITEPIDGLLVTGGHDMQSLLYGEDSTFESEYDPDRDEMEKELILRSLDREIPVFGICRGMQMINVVLGGKLYQDIYSSFPHLKRKRSPFPLKQAFIESGSKLYQAIQTKQTSINALHHQAVKKLGENLKPCAKDRFGLIQGIEHKEADFVLGVQWHPEYLFYRKTHRNLLKAFVQKCYERAHC